MKTLAACFTVLCLTAPCSAQTTIACDSLSEIGVQFMHFEPAGDHQLIGGCREVSLEGAKLLSTRDLSDFGGYMMGIRLKDGRKVYANDHLSIERELSK